MPTTMSWREGWAEKGKGREREIYIYARGWESTRERAGVKPKMLPDRKWS